MTSVFLTLSLAAVVLYTFWVLFKSRKKPSQKKVIRRKGKTKPVLKNKSTEKNIKSLPPNSEQIRKEETEKMKKDPELIGRVIRYWLNEK
ncbi:MAG: hypothetical protein HOK41_12165 [Nitrospina sp.]|nr:hypothetical protein [Nitrospina sp.]MBT6718644.1 hypothetical protein [Nitrospina sp.]